MSHPHGAYLGGIRTVEDLRQRCRVDEDTGCWHWGLSMCQGHPRVHLGVEGKRFAARGRRAALILAGTPPKRGHVAFATRECKSNDCVNPEHARSANRGNHGQYLRSTGLGNSPAKTAAAINSARTHLAKLTMEDARAIRASTESTYALARQFGVAQSCIWSVKAGKSWKEHAPQASVFTALAAGFGGAPNGQ